MSTKRLGSLSIDYLFDLQRDDVAAGEVGIVKDGAKDSLCQQMLNKHLFDSFF
jgi:hypothetical protein